MRPGRPATVPIPFLDLVRLHEGLRAELDDAWARVTRSGAFVGGPEVAAFEAAFARAFGVDDAVSCGSGTDALVLALAALGVGPGDEVIVPAMTFVATAEAVIHVGAVPVLADVDEDTLLLDADGVAAVRTDRTRAVVPVHLYGHAVDVRLLESWSADGLLVVEDAAQAHLARFADGRLVGTVGDAGCFSFYPGKNLGAFGDGGLALLPDAGARASAKALRDHGSSTKYIHDVPGWCSRLDGLQAAILAVKLEHLPAWNAARVALAERYRELLGPLLVPWADGAVHHLLVVRVAAGQREAIADALADGGISTGIHYPRALSEQPALGPWARPCPAAEAAAAEVLSLPMDPLMTLDEVDEVAAALLRAIGPR